MKHLTETTTKKSSKMNPKWTNNELNNPSKFRWIFGCIFVSKMVPEAHALDFVDRANTFLGPEHRRKAPKPIRNLCKMRSKSIPNCIQTGIEFAHDFFNWFLHRFLVPKVVQTEVNFDLNCIRKSIKQSIKKLMDFERILEANCEGVWCQKSIKNVQVLRDIDNARHAFHIVFCEMKRMSRCDMKIKFSPTRELDFERSKGTKIDFRTTKTRSWASNLGSLAGLGPPSWGLGPPWGLQVRVLERSGLQVEVFAALWASNMGRRHPSKFQAR